MCIAEIFTKVIIKVCIIHWIRHLVNHVLTLFSEFKFATNRNLICAELMRKAYQLGRPLITFSFPCSHFFLYKAPPSYTQAKNPYDQANFSGTNQYNNYPTGYEYPPQGQYPGYNNGARDSWQRHDTTDVVRY